jgi:hypothetical protein
MRWLASAVALAAVAALLAAPAGARPARLTADVAEWSVVPSRGVLAAGEVRIVAHNYGLLSHRLIVVRTARFNEALRVRGGHAVTTALADPIVVRPGETGSAVVRLRRGTYVVLDDRAGGYRNGAWAAFVVR